MGSIAFFSELSDRSRFLRFHGFADTGERLIRTMIEPDWDENGSLIGVTGEAGEETLVAVANYVRLRDRRVAEAAFAVADGWQRRGVGTRLLEQLATRAGESGIDEFVAEVLPDNASMLGVFENVGFKPTRTLEGGVVEVRFPIATHGGVHRRASTSATTSPSRPRCARSSSRARSQSSARRRDGDRSAASSSATSWPPTSPAPPTP